MFKKTAKAMDKRIAKLIQAFEEDGWVNNGIVDKKEWWFTDIYQLSSTWRPAGRILYLTLLIDIMIEQAQVVYCVGVSTSIPENRNHNFLQLITFNEIHHNLKAVVQKINERVLSLP